jgi:transposase-like protein
MSANKFTDEFKRDAVAQVENRGYPVREVAERLGVRCPAGVLRSNRREGAPSRSIRGRSSFRGRRR